MITKYKCNGCKKIKEIEFKSSFKEIDCHECNNFYGNNTFSYKFIGYFCPVCKHKLVQKHEGLVCKNYNCIMYFKLGKGWVYLENEKNRLDWTLKYKFDLNSFENSRTWLKLKSEILKRDNMTCQICKVQFVDLHVHHILPRYKNPELTFDKDNLITLCYKCHQKIHASEDKHYFGGKLK